MEGEAGPVPRRRVRVGVRPLSALALRLVGELLGPRSAEERFAVGVELLAGDECLFGCCVLDPDPFFAPLRAELLADCDVCLFAEAASQLREDSAAELRREAQSLRGRKALLLFGAAGPLRPLLPGDFLLAEAEPGAARAALLDLLRRAGSPRPTA